MHREHGLRLAEQAGDAHLEELVDVRGEDRAELHAFEQRNRVIRCELEDARVEVEQGELAVEQSPAGDVDTGCHVCIMHRRHSILPQALRRCASFGRLSRASRGRGPPTLGVGLVHGLLDGDTELEHPAAEGDAADREPRPAERQPCDHVAQPVEVQQDARARDCDRDRNSAAREESARP